MRTLIIFLAALLLFFTGCWHEHHHNHEYISEQFSQVLTLDDGYLFAGVRLRNGYPQTSTLDNEPPPQSDDIYLVRTDAAGNTLWEQSVYADRCDRVAVRRRDGGFVVIGTSPWGSLGSLIVKVDSVGHVLEQKRTADLDMNSPAVVVTIGGDFVLTGINEAEPNALRFMRIDENGSISPLGHFSLPDYHDNYVYDLIECADGGFAALTQNNLYRISAAGDSLWTASIWIFEAAVHAYSVREAESHDLIVAASREDQSPTSPDIALFGFDGHGQNVEELVYALQGGQYPTTLLLLPEQGCAVAGMAWPNGFGGANDAILIRAEEQGALLWSQHYDHSNYEGFSVLQQTSDGGFILAGDTDSGRENGGTDAWVVKTDASGVLQWQQTYGQ